MTRVKENFDLLILHYPVPLGHGNLNPYHVRPISHDIFNILASMVRVHRQCRSQDFSTTEGATNYTFTFISFIMFISKWNMEIGVMTPVLLPPHG